MRTYLILGILLVSSISCNYSLDVKSDENSKTAEYQQLYERSMKIKDLQTAITAIQLILLEDSSSTLRDSLPELYGAVNNLDACMATNEEALKRNPNSEKYKNIKVLCLQQIGDLDGQFTLLKDLFETTDKPQYLAQIAAIQIATDNLKDANETIDLMMTKYAKSTDSLEVFVDERRKQMVPVIAAAWNMKGYIYMQQKNISKAKDAFFAALEIYPDFVMPKNNLEAIFARK
ncbi:MAG: tetratricopeptide repeat protein [Bacteroidia bacterium]